MTEDKITEGVTCMACGSVYFDVGALVRHAIENPQHNAYTFGKRRGVLIITPLLDHHDAWTFWLDEEATPA
ncbi:hypothetical protein DSECCO2_213130 [anaerobic digester metagenome]